MIRFLRLRTRVYGDAKPTIPQSIISLLCSAVNGIIGVFMWFSLRDAVAIAAVRLGVTRWAINLVEISFAAILCILLLAFVLVAQHQYERDFMSSWLPKRFIVYTVIQIIIFAATVWYIS